MAEKRKKRKEVRDERVRAKAVRRRLRLCRMKGPRNGRTGVG